MEDNTVNKSTIILTALAVCLVLAFFYLKKRKEQQQQTTMPVTLQPATTQKQETIYSQAPIQPATPKTNPVVAPPANSAQSVTMGVKGFTVYPKGTSVNVRREPSTGSQVVANIKSGKKAGTTTGEIKMLGDGIWYKIQLEFGTGWVRNDVVTLIPTSNEAIQSWLPFYNSTLKGVRL